MMDYTKQRKKYSCIFFNHEYKNSVVRKPDYLDLYPAVGLVVLVEKSLIKMNDVGVWMHDLVQDMGRKIVHEECPEEPGKHSILWSFEDINSVLTKNTVRGYIYPIILFKNVQLRVALVIIHFAIN